MIKFIRHPLEAVYAEKNTSMGIDIGRIVMSAAGIV
jgi:hypothetical protein